MKAGRFPDDEPLSDRGNRQLKRLAALRKTRHLTAPERRARRTAELLGMQPTVEPRLADLDCKGWRGQTLRAIDARALEIWLTVPADAPQGGESIIDLIRRVGDWLECVTEGVRTVAVTHPAVIRAAILLALGAPPRSFWRIDIEPASRTILHYRDGRWALPARTVFTPGLSYPAAMMWPCPRARRLLWW